jgi:enoyl-[acyl-carrier protein] reductase I
MAAATEILQADRRAAACRATAAVVRRKGPEARSRAWRAGTAPGATRDRNRDSGLSDLTRKLGLIVGVANKRSISWAIAQTAAAAGARLALTYPSERLEQNVRELAATLDHPLVLPCDVSSDEEIAALATALEREFGGLDFLVHGAAFAPKTELDNPFLQTSREGFRIALDVSAYSLIGLTRAVTPLMVSRGGGSVLTLTYLGSQRAFPNYNVMGVAKAALESTVRYLAADLGPQNIRVNAISAGAIKTLAAAGISGFSTILQVYRDKAPLRRGVDQSEVAEAALFLLSHSSRAVTGEVLMVDAGFHAVGI